MFTSLSLPVFAFLHHFGPMEMVVVGFVALLIFGNRLPGAMRSLGKSVTEFKKGMTEIEDQLDTAGKPEAKPAKPE
ncbi:MAG TPA: twin-arginine translocase TatA/TatE family subunit [Isosphaeraceae bacterium]|jgi:sec-independent protein translocase protein TatA|nr:twin-arginine translocase TatA/TatE family subunit [Isosphaeraceae bacterium]